MVIDNYLRFSAGELKRKDEARLKRSLTFSPAEGVESTSYRPKASGGLWVPRGMLAEIPDYVRVRDKRSFPKMMKYEPNIVLDYKDDDKEFVGQAECIAAMREHKQGLIHRSPGSGKSNIALYFIATAGTRSLVIVHTEDILQQWLTYAARGIPDMPVGVIRGSQESIQQLTIATIQTLYRRNLSAEWYRQFGCTIFDETHHVAANSFLAIASHVTSRYFFGMSASRKRADKMHPLISFYIGPVIHEQEFSAPMPVTVEKIKTKFRSGKAITGPMWLRRKRWHGMIDRLISDPRRNAQIARWTASKLDEGRSTLVLSRRVEHLENIQRELKKRGHESVILAAKLMSKPERRKMVAEFRSGKIKCVLATQLADEALDVPILSAVALAYPGKHTDLVLQQVGRALREHPGKESAVIGDFADLNVKSLRSQYHGRRRFYLHAGFKITGDGLRGRSNRVVKKVKRKVTRFPKRKQKVVLGRIR